MQRQGSQLGFELAYGTKRSPRRDYIPGGA